MRSRAFSLCAAVTFYASATLSAPPPKAPFTEQLSSYPQEKLYVHTDKEHYLAGDTVWLRAHCIDAATSTSSYSTTVEYSYAASRSSDATASTPSIFPCRTTPRATTPCAPTRFTCVTSPNTVHREELISK